MNSLLRNPVNCTTLSTHLFLRLLNSTYNNARSNVNQKAYTAYLFPNGHHYFIIGMDRTPTMIQLSLYSQIVPLNIDLGIFNQLGWVFFTTTLFFHWALISLPSMTYQLTLYLTHLVSEFATLSFGFIYSTNITTVESSYLMILCLGIHVWTYHYTYCSMHSNCRLTLTMYANS